MKRKEDMRVVHARLDRERDRLAALLREWPLERRAADQIGYTNALKAWRTSCVQEEE
jgi:hypothetical protein